MKISARTDYACKALLELSLREDGQPLQIKIIAKRQRIPIKFLVHILIQLKQLGYVDSARGKNGGYVLIKKPFDVKLKDIVDHFEGGQMLAARSRSQSEVMGRVWQQVRNSVFEALKGIDFEHIRNQHLRQSTTISYDI